MNNRIVFRVSAESALDLDSFIESDLPKALEFLNCPECYSGWECGFMLETESTPLARIPEIEIDLKSAKANPIFNEDLTNTFLESSPSGLTGFISPDVARDKDALIEYLKSLDPERWRYGLEEKGRINFVTGEMLSGGMDSGGGE